MSVPPFIQRAAFGAEFPWPLADTGLLGRGGRQSSPCVRELVDGPLHDTEGIVVAERDLRQTRHAMRRFDAAGHHSRADVRRPKSSRETCPDNAAPRAHRAS